MEFRAIHRYAPLAASKARPVVNMVRGLGANQALETLEFVPRRAAPMLVKLIRSAIANAGQEGGVEAGQLVIKGIWANEGPLKQGRLRWRPGPRGRSRPIRKRSCHLEVLLESIEVSKPRRRRKAEPAEAKGPEQGGAPEAGGREGEG